MTNLYLDPSLHDEDLHREWLRVDGQLQLARESSDHDLSDSFLMEREQIAEAIAARAKRRDWFPPQPGSRDSLPLQAF